MITTILHNAFILLLPAFIWNLVFYKRLPDFYQPAQWDNISKTLDVTENVFRFMVFLLPLFFRIGPEPGPEQVT